MTTSDFEYPPGSEKALDNGCTCPVLDNNHGRGAYNSEGYIINADCPLHNIDDLPTR